MRCFGSEQIRSRLATLIDLCQQIPCETAETSSNLLELALMCHLQEKQERYMYMSRAQGNVSSQMCKNGSEKSLKLCGW